LVACGHDRPRVASSLSLLRLSLLAGGCPRNELIADDPPEATDTGSESSTGTSEARYHATIRRTSHGIAHITAGDLGSAGFGC
jgi:acyl-homoserine lactone acylase PvdQ